ncbi:hypothetical protein [Pantoea vagans]|uniref:hypothetical protein n=1 Tax=Pantoea vagans TaxID=470934 RepID=UPI003B01276E
MKDNNLSAVPAVSNDNHYYESEAKRYAIMRSEVAGKILWKSGQYSGFFSRAYREEKMLTADIAVKMLDQDRH